MRRRDNGMKWHYYMTTLKRTGEKKKAEKEWEVWTVSWALKGFTAIYNTYIQVCFFQQQIRFNTRVWESFNGSRSHFILLS